MFSNHANCPEDWENPDFTAFDADKSKKVHEWKTYIKPHLRNVYLHLDRIARYHIAINAQQIADEEDWD